MRRFELAPLFGIPLRLDLSWFLIVALVTISLAGGLFPAFYPDLAPAVYWIMGVAGAFGLFASVTLHELGHALVARRLGVGIHGITLFIFGGVAEMESEPPNPSTEFLIAVAGPAVSLVLGVGFLFLHGVGILGGWSAPVLGVISHLGIINLMLLGFNLIPAFPLDGGRVLRSGLWKLRGDLNWATRISARLGAGFGILLMVAGVLRMVAGGDLMGGLWSCLIGTFLYRAANITQRQSTARAHLADGTVERFMRRDPVVVPRSLSVADLVSDIVHRHRLDLYPVVDRDRLIGCISLQRLREIPREEWNRQSAGAIASACPSNCRIAPNASALQALGRLSGSGGATLLVIDGNDHLVGTLTLPDLLGAR